MNRRFISTDIWKKLRNKSDKARILFLYAWTKCDEIGIYSVDLAYIQTDLGKRYIEKDFDELCEDDFFIKLGDGTYAIMDFIEVCHTTLKADYNPHKPAFRALARLQKNVNSSLNEACDKLVILSNPLYSNLSTNTARAREEKPVGLPIPLETNFSSDFVASCWQKWKDYKKKKHKFTFHDIETEKDAIDGLWELSGGDEKHALKIIKQSMTNGWKGLFELKNKSEVRVRESDAVRDDFYNNMPR